MWTLFIWMLCMWLVKMTAKPKFCPDISSFWPDIVRWSAVILSPATIKPQFSKFQCEVIWKGPQLNLTGVFWTYITFTTQTAINHFILSNWPYLSSVHVGWTKKPVHCSGENQMERSFPLEKFLEKWNTFGCIPLFSFLLEFLEYHC